MEEKLIKELHKKFNIRPLPSNQEMYSTLKNAERIRPLTARGAREGPTELQLTARKVDVNKVLIARKQDAIEPYSGEQKQSKRRKRPKTCKNRDQIMSSHHFKQSFVEINKYKDLSEIKKSEVNLQNKNAQR